MGIGQKSMGTYREDRSCDVIQEAVLVAQAGEAVLGPCSGLFTFSD